eukprot:14837111-Alexandrium_andersonii.AAC.1
MGQVCSMKYRFQQFDMRPTGRSGMKEDKAQPWVDMSAWSKASMRRRFDLRCMSWACRGTCAEPEEPPSI